MEDLIDKIEGFVPKHIVLFTTPDEEENGLSVWHSVYYSEPPTEHDIELLCQELREDTELEMQDKVDECDIRIVNEHNDLELFVLCMRTFYEIDFKGEMNFDKGDDIRVDLGSFGDNDE